MRIFPSSYHITSFKIKLYFLLPGNPVEWGGGALPYVVYTGMCCPQLNIYYFNILIVSTIHSHKEHWVSLSKWFCLCISIILFINKSLAPTISLLSLIHTRFILNFPVKLVHSFRLSTCCLTNMARIAPSVSLPLFMSYPILWGQMHASATCRSNCTIISGTIFHFTCLTKTI